MSRVFKSSLQRVGVRVCTSVYTQVWGRMDHFWTHEEGQKSREGRETFHREGIGDGIISGFYFRALRGVLGAFSSLQIAQD